MPGFTGVEVTPVHNARIAARTVRYIVRNACAAELVEDPLEWPWSTHRDVLGAIANPWVDAERLASALGQPREGFVAAHHRYVSTDAHRAPYGSPLPVPARAAVAPRYSLPDYARAAASAMRGEPADIQGSGRVRQLFVQVAVATGWRDQRSLALACRASRSTIWRLSNRDCPELSAGLLCLGDARLLEHRVRLAGETMRRKNAS